MGSVFAAATTVLLITLSLPPLRLPTGGGGGGVWVVVDVLAKLHLCSLHDRLSTALSLSVHKVDGSVQFEARQLTLRFCIPPPQTAEHWIDTK